MGEYYKGGCPACGEPIHAGHILCKKCGSKLT